MDHAVFIELFSSVWPFIKSCLWSFPEGPNHVSELLADLRKPCRAPIAVCRFNASLSSRRRPHNPQIGGGDQACSAAASFAFTTWASESASAESSSSSVTITDLTPGATAATASCTLAMSSWGIPVPKMMAWGAFRDSGSALTLLPSPDELGPSSWPEAAAGSSARADSWSRTTWTT